MPTTLSMRHLAHYINPVNQEFSSMVLFTLAHAKISGSFTLFEIPCEPHFFMVLRGGNTIPTTRIYFVLTNKIVKKLCRGRKKSSGLRNGFLPP